MIISASRRTDIPAFYSEWFLNRIREGFVLVRNPMNPKMVSRVSLSPDLVDGIVFWTKNPKPMIVRLDELINYPFYFQFTLNPYGNDIETNLPSKSGERITTFKELSDTIGSSKVMWRYDPILLNEKYNLNYHIDHFEKMARHLKGYTRKCTISFIDYYRSITSNIKELSLKEVTEDDMNYIAKNFAAIAKDNGIKLDTCAEKIDLNKYDIAHAKCVDDELLREITGYRYNVQKDKNQRPECGCAMSIDIGTYNTCQNGCRYCYANHSLKTVEENALNYDVMSQILCGKLSDSDVIKDREVKSCKDGQIEFDLK